MRDLIIKETFVNTDQLIKSGLAEKWFDNFGMKHILADKLKRMPEYGACFYIVEADPEHNYGLDFNIYAHYKADGINFLKQLCITSAITSALLHRAMIGGGFIHFSAEAYSKENKDRPGLRKASEAGWVFH